MSRDLDQIKEAVLGDDVVEVEEQQTPARSAATQIVETALSTYHLGVSDDGEPFGMLKLGPPVVHMLRGGKVSLRGQLARDRFRATGRVAPQQALSDALATLEGFALEQEPTTLYQRVARHDGALWLDLGCSKGRAVRIAPDGWQVVDEAPVRFKRTPLTGPLPTPVQGGQLGELWSWVHATSEDRPLVAAYLVAALMPDIAHPVLGLFGEQGSGKTTAMKAVTLTIDPGPVPYRKPPRDADSWVTAASGSWVVALDNVSHVPDWLSDTLCRAVTGEGDVRRRLYSDSELATFAFRRVIAMTGIDLGSLNGDLADRLLPVHLERISDGERREETTMWGSAWHDAHPRILGAVLTLAADVLARLHTTKLERMPRMADFARVADAVDQVLGTSGLKRYLGAQGRLAADTLSGDDFITRLTETVTTSFEGTAAELLAKVTPTDEGWRRPKGWPANARLVTQRLRRQAPVLRKVGWEVDEDGGANKVNATRWTLVAPPPPEIGRDSSSPSSPSSPLRQGRDKRGESEGEFGESGESGESEARKADPPTRQAAAPDSRQGRPSRSGASQASQASHGNGQSLHDRAVAIVAELRHLDPAAIHQRFETATQRITPPAWWAVTVKNEPVQVTAAVELIAVDHAAGHLTGDANRYLSATRAATSEGAP